VLFFSSFVFVSFFGVGKGAVLMRVLSQVQSFLNADCAETRWSRDHGATQDVAFGCYELDEKSGERRGEIVVARVSDDVQLCLVKSVQTSGVFDIKWSGDGDAICAACADGTVKFFPKLMHRNEFQSLSVCDGAFALSVDWNDRVNVGGAKRIAMSRSDGCVTIVEIRETGPVVVKEWNAHNYPGPAPAEVWIVAFDAFCPDVVASGGDDQLLKIWDTRLDCSAPVMKNKLHEAGVCSLQYHPRKESILASGSYDSCVRIWDKRKLHAPIVEPFNCGGGVWRLKWSFTEDDLLLIAAMRSGFLSVKVDPNEITKKSSYRPEGLGPGKWESLAYGADWVKLPGKMELGIVGASFYNKTFHLFE